MKEKQEFNGMGIAQGVWKKRPGNGLEERLVSGESVIAQAQIHWGIYWQSAAVLLLALVFSVFVAPELGLFLLLVGGIMAFYAWLRKAIFVLVVTNKRIFARYGILQVDVVDIHFDKIESMELERMPTSYLMGYSNVVVQGTGQRRIVIPYVANGPEIRKAYNEQVLG